MAQSHCYVSWQKIAAGICVFVFLAAAPPESPKAAIQRVLDDQAKAWNKGDLEAFMDGYWKSPDLSVFVRKGPDARLGRDVAALSQTLSIGRPGNG